MADSIEKNIENIEKLREQVEKLRDSLQTLQEDFDTGMHFESILNLMNNLDKASDIVDDFATKADSIDKVGNKFKALDKDVISSANALNIATEQVNRIASELGSTDLVDKLNLKSALSGLVGGGTDDVFEQQRLAIYNIVSSMDTWIEKTDGVNSAVASSMRETKEAILDVMETYKQQGNFEAYKESMAELSQHLVNIKEQYKNIKDEQKEAFNQSANQAVTDFHDQRKLDKYNAELEIQKETLKKLSEEYGATGKIASSAFEEAEGYIHHSDEIMKEFGSDTATNKDILEGLGRSLGLLKDKIKVIEDAGNAISAFEHIKSSMDTVIKKYLELGSISQAEFDSLNNKINKTSEYFEQGLNIDTFKNVLDKISREYTKLELKGIDVELGIDKNKVTDHLAEQIEEAVGKQIRIPIELSTLSTMAQESTVDIGGKLPETIEFYKSIPGTIKKAFSELSGIFSQLNNLCNAIIGAIKTLVSIATSGFRLIGKAISSVVSVTKNVLTLFGSLSDRVRSIADSIHPIETLKEAFRSLTGHIADSIDSLGNFGASIEKIFNNSVTSRANELFTSVYSMVNIVGKEEADNVINWAKNLEYAFGLSSAGLIANLNKLTGVMYGVGLAAKDVGTASKNFSFLAEYFVGQGLVKNAETAINAFTSAMRGSVRSVSQLGIVMSDNALDQYLKKLKETGKISKEVTSDFTKLSTEAKAYVRYSYLISQASDKYDLSNYANNIKTVTGRMNALNNALLTLRHTISTGLYKALASLAPLITSLLKLVNMAVVQIFKLFNIDVNISSDMNEGAGAVSGVGDAANESTESLKEMEDAANKAKGAVLGFDKVTSLYAPSSSGSDLDDLTDFDYSGLIDGELFDISSIENKTEDIFDILKKKTEDFEAWAKRKIRGFEILNGSKYFREDFDLEFDWDRIKKNLEKIHTNIKKTIENWTDFFIVLGLKVLDDLNVGRIVTEFTEFIRAASELARVMSEVLTPALDAFYELGLRPIVEWLGDKLADALIFATAELDKWSAWFIENKDVIYTFFESLGRIVAAVWGVFEPYFNASWDWLKDKISGIGEELRGILDNIMGNTIKNEGTIIDTIETWPERIDNVIKKIRLAFATLFGTSLSLEETAEVGRLLEQSSGAIAKLKSGEDLTGDETFSIVLNALNNINSIAKDVLDIVIEVGKAFGDWAKNEGLPWLLEKLEQLGKWIKDHKNDIVKLMEKLASFAWESFEKFVDIVGKLVNLAVEHPDAVVFMLKAIIAVKLFSWATSLISPLTTIVGLLIQMSGLSVPKWLALLSGNLGLNVAAFSGPAATASAVTNAGTAATAGTATNAGGAGILGALGPLAAIGGLAYADFKLIERLPKTIDEINEGVYSALEDINKDKIKDKVVDALNQLSSNVTSMLDLNDFVEVATKEGAERGKEEALNSIQAVYAAYANLYQGISDGTYTGIDKISPELQALMLERLEDAKDKLGELYDTTAQLTESEVLAKLPEIEQILTNNIEDTAKYSTYMSDNVRNDTIDAVKTHEQYLKDTINNNVESSVTSLEDLTKTHEQEVNIATSSGKEQLTKSSKTDINTSVTSLEDLTKKYSTDIENIAREKKKGFIDTIGGILSGIGSSVVNFVSGIFNEANSGGVVKTNKVKAQNPVTMHAAGGSIAGGQLFIANESGGAELVGNITGASGAQVANNGMIIKAIQEASRLGIQAGMSPLVNKLGTSGEKTVNINFNSGTLVTPDALRAFAIELAPLLNSTNINIANTGFSI